MCSETNLKPLTEPEYQNLQHESLPCSPSALVALLVVPVLQVVVQRVHIDGLSRTKEDLLTREISGVFRAKNLIDVGPVEASCGSNP